MLESSFANLISAIIIFIVSDQKRVPQTAFNIQEEACNSAYGWQKSEYDSTRDHATRLIIRLVKSQIQIALTGLGPRPYELLQQCLLLNYHLWLNCGDWLHNYLILNTINELCLRLHTSSCHRLHTLSHHWLHASWRNWHHLLLSGNQWCLHHHWLSIRAHCHHLHRHLRLLN